MEIVEDLILSSAFSIAPNVYSFAENDDPVLLKRLDRSDREL